MYSFYLEWGPHLSSDFKSSPPFLMSLMHTQGRG